MPMPNAPRVARRGKRCLQILMFPASACLACLWCAPRAAAQSGTITMTAGDGDAQTSWNTGDRWSDTQAPHGDADYLVDSTTGNIALRTPPTMETSTFAGKSLTLRNNAAVGITLNSNASLNGGPLAIKSTAGSKLTINDLRLESRSAQAMIKYDAASTGMITLAGNISLVTGTSRILLNTANLVTFAIESNISGDGGLWLDNWDGSNTNSLFVLGGANTYTGVTLLTGGTSFANGVTLRLDSDTALGSTSALKLDSAAATLDLNGRAAAAGALTGTFASSLITNHAAATTAALTVATAGADTTYAG
ncbi:MAG: hypothetical protein LBC18_06805, partial [Opitutaceae bacterium]|nr:hypothetical protein [Opitutaceae bacterium]